MSNCTTEKPEYDHAAIFSEEYVAWVESYQYIGRISEGYHYKIKANNGTSLDAVFCRAVDFWDVVDKTPIPKDLRNNSTWIIVEDFMEPMEIDRYIYTRKNPFVPFFMNARSSVHYDMLTWNLLDGLIQEKLKRMCEGTDD